MSARGNVLRVLDAIRDGPSDRQGPPTEAELEQIREKAREIAEAAQEVAGQELRRLRAVQD